MNTRSATKRKNQTDSVADVQGEGSRTASNAPKKAKTLEAPRSEPGPSVSRQEALVENKGEVSEAEAEESSKGKSRRSDIRRRSNAAKRQRENTFTFPHDSPMFDMVPRKGSRLEALKAFVEKLDNISKFPNAGNEDELLGSNLLDPQSKSIKHREQVFAGYKQRKGQMVGHKNIDIIQTEAQLRALLASPWRLPVYVPGESELGKSLCKEGAFTGVDDFVQFNGPLSEGEAPKRMFVQNLDVAKIDNDEWTLDEVATRLKPKNRQHFNCLDIEVPDHLVKYRPSALNDVDVLGMSQQSERSLGRGEQTTAKSLEQFFLLSKKGSVSETHVDSGGVLTWVYVLDGSKWWYFNAALDTMPAEDQRRFLAQGTDEPAGYSGEWCRIHLQKGDFFMMPPGTLHAVYTPETSLCAGGFALTTHQVHTSLSIIPVLERHQTLTNDHPPGQMFQIYRNIYKQALRGRFASREGLQNLLLALEDFLDFQPPTVSKSSKKKPTDARENWCKAWQQFAHEAEQGKWVEKLDKLYNRDT